MSNQIQTLYFLGQPVRMILDEKQNPWFVAMDVSSILEYKDTEAMTRKLDEDEIQNLQIVGFGNRGINLINESGLYSSILSSDKPQAKPFKKWVTEEVLPSIRKHGYYSVDNHIVIENDKPLISINEVREICRKLDKIDTEKLNLEHSLSQILNPSLSKPSKLSKTKTTHITEYNMRPILVEFFNFIFSGQLIYDVEYRIEKVKSTGEENLLFKLPLVYNHKFQEHYLSKFGTYPPALPQFLQALADFRKINPAKAIYCQKLFHNTQSLQSKKPAISYKNCVSIPMAVLPEICEALPPSTPRL